MSPIKNMDEFVGLEPEVILRAVDGSADFTRFEVSSSGPLFG